MPPSYAPHPSPKPTEPVQAQAAPKVINPRPYRNKKTVLIALAIIAILALAGGSTFFILSHVTKQIPQSTTKTAKQQAAELARQANDAATASANKGDTQGALDHYNEALIQYQKAGDKAGEQGVQLQIQYYEQVKANEDKAKAEAATSSSTTNQ